jgi:hypothetical protein
MVRRGWLSVLRVLSTSVAFAALVAPVASAQAASRSFVYTGGEQTFVVPAGVSSIHVLAVGGSGGDAFPGGGAGGASAVVSGEETVTPGQTLYVEVGGSGQPELEGGHGGFNGGGEGGPTPFGAGGGGGASDVRTAPIAAGLLPDKRLLVAGAGGGGGGFGAFCLAAGGAGGAAGQRGENGHCGNDGGHPGTQTEGGQPGTNGCGPGDEGRLGTGGAGGGDGLFGNFCNNSTGGGGGAGLYGGGGGCGGNQNAGGGGGGGSSRVPAGGSVAIAAAGEQPHVELSYVQTIGRAPTITALSKRKGPAAGGASVTISGTSFVGVTAVDFGAVGAASYVVDSPTSITAVSPAHTTGVVEVTVTTPNGESGISRSDSYNFEHPTVTAVSPGAGPRTGATAVTVSGSGFALGAELTRFKFGKGFATSVACASTTSCTMLTPAAVKAGAIDVIAKVGTRSSPPSPPADRFAYE